MDLFFCDRYFRRGLALVGVLLALPVSVSAQGVVPVQPIAPLPLNQPAPPSSVPIQPTAIQSGICPVQLASRLNAIADRLPTVRWGIWVQTQADPAKRQTLYTRNASGLLIPASNNKLFTTAAALQKFGAAYRIRTTVTGNSTRSALATLRIIGRGDPSLNAANLTTLATQLSQRGIRETALLIGDDTYFRGAAINPNWDADDTLEGYGAPINSLMVNQNAIGLTLFPQRVGQPLRVQWDDPTDASGWRLDNQAVTVSASQGESIDAYRDRTQRLIHIEGQLRAGSASESVAAAIDNPGNYLVQKFRDALIRAKITVRQVTVVKATPAAPGEVELAAIESPTLGELLKETNQESNNIYAETLLRAVGRAQNPATLDASNSGIYTIKSILTALGVNPNLYSMVDGSGLASRNRASAEALGQTLQAIALTPNAAVFRASLPVAGISGTLKDRFRNTAAQGRLQAKTGTISGVVSLSGYLTPPNYNPVVLSFVANYSGASASAVRGAVDEMVVVLTQLRRC